MYIIPMKYTVTAFYLFLSCVYSFVPAENHGRGNLATQFDSSAQPSDVDSFSSAATIERLQELKMDLVRLCTRTKAKPSRNEVQSLVSDLESVAQQVNVGQFSSKSGLLSGQWELLYAPEDKTRASPFFWAFRKAFPDNSDQIFGITDAIPASLKEIGDAYQVIELNQKTETGRFVSRVKVTTLGGMATSIMTTRGSVVGFEGSDGLRLRVETTKPEDSTLAKTFLGPLGDVLNENTPPFPSGEALERARPGSSEVVMRTTFCDEGLRISRDGERLNDIFVWRRRDFETFDFI